MAIIEVGRTRTFSRINDAIAFAQPNDILFIDEGFYNEKVLLDSKPVHLVGKGRPGKVVMSANLNQIVLDMYNVVDSTVYVENIYIKCSYNRYASGATTIRVRECDGSTFHFNKCVLSCGYTYSYIFRVYYEHEAKLIYLTNCNLIFLRAERYSGTLTAQINYGTNAPFDIQKCVSSNQFLNISNDYFERAPGIITNLVDETNMTSTTFSGLENVLDHRIDTYTTASGATGDWHNIDIDFGASPEVVDELFLRPVEWSDWSAMRFQASNNYTDWVTLKELPYLDELAAHFTFNSSGGSYRYYKLGVKSYNDVVRLGQFFISRKGESLYPDAVVDKDTYGYGVNYGESIGILPKLYYFSGKISDNINNGLLHNVVTFDDGRSLTNVNFSEDNKTVWKNGDATQTPTRAAMTISRGTGKWYWEFKRGDYTWYNKSRFGIGDSSLPFNTFVGDDIFSWGFSPYEGRFYHNGVSKPAYATAKRYDTIGIAMDLFNGKIWWSVNGEWLLNGDPSYGVNPVYDNVFHTVSPMVNLQTMYNSRSEVTVQFGPGELEYTPPIGFEMYGASTIWDIILINADTNEVMTTTTSDIVTTEYELITTYSGAHFIICEDNSEVPPTYNDLVFGEIYPEEYN